MNDRFVHPSAILDAPLRLLTGCVQSKIATTERLVLPQVCYIGPFCVICCGVLLGERVILDSYVSIDPGASIGDDTLITYRASIGGGAKIGRGCVIGGFIPENTVIGDRSRVLGTLTHLHENPAMVWDHHEVPEASPIIKEDVFVGLGATVIGPITLHRKSYICAGAIVTIDVPEKHIVSRSGKVIYYKEWKGRLKNSEFFGD